MTAQEPGSRLAEELALLLAAAAERVGPWLDRVAATEHSDSPCEMCPLCAVVALVRGEPNELAAKSIDRLADVVALLRAVLADRWQPGEPHMPGFKPEEAPRSSDRVQRIPIRRTGVSHDDDRG
ncbi:hypothetical protein [Actinokineospora globicatena]|uniref:hypothetical protein n=1 Tax=Actinokineospora globicatena TaxID=103729 RepID=UPI0020A3B581|nr:hypothetical protein [Actinokineospora globicatena]MCP2302531.1 hypothetical protein [Actinokineospora globicatena]GLW75782.1 hypothetical protein Aglo01_02640 [Actinokineospora globicatena]GLW82622.1 hypothetical protein Aglo02_02630 [Actinokineospora globicatena]